MHKDADGLYSKPFSYCHTLDEKYGKDHATGANVGNVNDEEEEIEEDAGMDKKILRENDMIFALKDGSW